MFQLLRILDLLSLSEAYHYKKVSPYTHCYFCLTLICTVLNRKRVLLEDMVSTTYLEPVPSRILLLTNILSSVRIEKLAVPEAVALEREAAELECWYSGAGADVSVQWLLAGAPVFHWTSGSQPRVCGLLEGRVDPTSIRANVAGVSLRVSQLALALSGEYACEVRSRHSTARAAANMTVFSPERDFELTFNSSVSPGAVDVKCVARHLHPQPDLVIEYNKVRVPQQQRAWREAGYFAAECLATLAPRPAPAPAPPGELACRLHLPGVDYTAITKKYLYYGDRVNSGVVNMVSFYFSILCSIILIV